MSVLRCFGNAMAMYLRYTSKIGYGKPMKNNVKDVLAAIYYVLDTGIQWRRLPRTFVPASTVHKWHQRFVRDGIYDIVHEHILMDLQEQNLLDLSRTFIDGSFIRSKGGHDKVGKTKAGKGSKTMAIVDDHGIPISLHIENANPHESKSVEKALDDVPDFLPKIEILVGDKAYDSDPLDEKIKAKKSVDLIAPHKKNRKKEPTQDPEKLKENYSKRYKIENFFGLFQWTRRVVVRYEKKSINCLGFALLRAAFCALQIGGLFNT